MTQRPFLGGKTRESAIPTATVEVDGAFIRAEIPGVGRIRAMNHGDVIAIDDVRVAEGLREQGYGTELYRAVIEKCPGAKMISGEPDGDNLAVLRATGDINKTPRAKILSKFGFTEHVYDKDLNMMYSSKPNQH